MIMAQKLTYSRFKNLNDTSKRMGVTCGHIDCVDLKNNICVLNVEGNKTSLDINQLVADIAVNGMGCVSNPSVLKNWKEWG